MNEREYYKRRGKRERDSYIYLPIYAAINRAMTKCQAIIQMPHQKKTETIAEKNVITSPSQCHKKCNRKWQNGPGTERAEGKRGKRRREKYLRN